LVGGWGEQKRAPPRLAVAAAPTRRAPLNHTQNTHARAGEAELLEVIAALRAGAPPADVRPARVAAMLASRACRGAIMVGRALDAPAMRRLLDGMSSLRAPWTCAHGRPTMRHLAVLPPPAAAD
jgi:DNA mismatch repair protein PMS2